MQGGGGETGDGVSLGFTEETHGAERVTAEERGWGAQGIQLIALVLKSSNKHRWFFFTLFTHQACFSKLEHLLGSKCFSTSCQLHTKVYLSCKLVSIPLQGQLSRVMCDMRALLGAERLRRQELAETELEKRELLELLRDLQPTRSQHPVEQAARDQHQGDQQTPGWELYTGPTRHQQREASLHASSLSLHSSQAINASGPPPSPQLGEGARKGGTRSLTLDCIKRKSREVTVIWVNWTGGEINRTRIGEIYIFLIFPVHNQFYSFWDDSCY